MYVIGKNIQKFLDEKEIKPYKMAKEIGISHGNIYDILNEKNNNPSIYVLKKIADFLDVKVDDLL